MDATLDIESLPGFDRFYLGGLQTSDGFELFRNADDMVWRVLGMPRGTRIHAKGGGRYDYIWLLQEIHERGVPCKAIPAGERIIRLEIENGPTLLDTSALVPYKLNGRTFDSDIVALDIAGLPDYGTELDCICERECGGYCRFGEKWCERFVVEYLERDCSTLWDVVDSSHLLLDRAGLTVRNTLGTTGWATARDWIGIEPMRWDNWQHYRFARKAFYGGRCEVFQVEADEGHRTDLNSAYPWALSKAKVPVGPYRRIGRDRASNAYSRGRPGVYRCKVTVPQHHHMPPLPWRLRDRVYYPVGTFTGEWTSVELHHAERRGAQIERVISAIVWSDQEAPLAPVADRMMQRRWEHKTAGTRQGTAMSNLLKRCANALIGKLAQKPEGFAVKVHPDTDRIKLCPGKGTCDTRECSGFCRRWVPMNRDLSIWKVPYWAIPDCSYAHWSATVNSFVRVELMQQALGEGMVYVDTDAVYSTVRRFHNEGDGLGQWGYEGTFYHWKAVGPKMARYIDEQGIRHTVHRGIVKMTWEDFERYDKGEQLKFQSGVKSLMAALRAGGPLFVRKKWVQSKQDRGPRIGGRVLDKATGMTWPVDAAELATWEQS